MPKYLILEKSYIDNRIVPEGTEIVTDADPGDHWQPLDAEAEAAKAAMLKSRASIAESARKQIAEIGAENYAMARASTADAKATAAGWAAEAGQPPDRPAKKAAA